jgi:hypothetical protein
MQWWLVHQGALGHARQNYYYETLPITGIFMRNVFYSFICSLFNDAFSVTKAI